MTMKAESYYNTREKHGYEVQGYGNAGPVTSHVIVGRYVRERTGEEMSKREALAILAERPDVVKVHVYHTHPSPGPIRRFLATVNRDGVFRYAYDGTVAHTRVAA